MSPSFLLPLHRSRRDLTSVYHILIRAINRFTQTCEAAALWSFTLSCSNISSSIAVNHELIISFSFIFLFLFFLFHSPFLHQSIAVGPSSKYSISSHLCMHLQYDCDWMNDLAHHCCFSDSFSRVRFWINLQMLFVEGKKRPPIKTKGL